MATPTAAGQTPGRRVVPTPYPRGHSQPNTPAVNRA